MLLDEPDDCEDDGVDPLGIQPQCILDTLGT